MQYSSTGEIDSCKDWALKAGPKVKDFTERAIWDILLSVKVVVLHLLGPGGHLTWRL